MSHFSSDIGITIENETYVVNETDSVQVCVRVIDGTLERNVTSPSPTYLVMCRPGSMAGKGLAHGAQGRADAIPLAAHQRHTTGAVAVV